MCASRYCALNSSSVVINGTNLGPAGTSGTNVAVSYSRNAADPTEPVFTATGCSVVVAHTSVVCTSAPGAGTQLLVTLVIGGQSSGTPSLAMGALAYQPPTMISLSGRGTSMAETPGGQSVFITGTQFGPVSVINAASGAMSPPLSASYGYMSDGTLRYTAASCAVTVANTIISCLTAPGVGKNLVWQVTVFGQTSARLTTHETSYAPPTTASFSGPGSDLALTSGYQSVVIGGMLECRC